MSVFVCLVFCQLYLFLHVHLPEYEERVSIGNLSESEYMEEIEPVLRDGMQLMKMSLAVDLKR